MERQIKEFAKRTGYKKKKGMWFDKQGFPCSESEIISYFREIQRVIVNKIEQKRLLSGLQPFKYMTDETCPCAKD